MMVSASTRVASHRECTVTEPQVGNFMTTDVVSFHPGDDVPGAVSRLVERGIDGAPVVDDAGKVVGMLSASDAIIQDAQLDLPTIVTLFGMSAELPRGAARFNRDVRKALASTVGELMADNPVLVGAAASMTDAATLMHDHDVSRLPVVDADNRLIGIVARGDVLRYLVGTAEMATGGAG